MLSITSKKSRVSSKKILVVIGGGKTIDQGKVFAKKNKMICVAIPTTGAGASETSHAVLWTKNKKKNIKTDKPVSIAPPFKVKLSKQARRESTFDILGHIVDYLNVCSDNELIELGMHAGKLIEKHPTNLTHPASYPLTLEYGLPHGEAVGAVLCACIIKAFKPKEISYEKGKIRILRANGRLSSYRAC
jgi:alcohol dehydrogenase class IV